MYEDPNSEERPKAKRKRRPKTPKTPVDDASPIAEVVQDLLASRKVRPVTFFAFKHALRGLKRCLHHRTLMQDLLASHKTHTVSALLDLRVSGIILSLLCVHAWNSHNALQETPYAAS